MAQEMSRTERLLASRKERRRKRWSRLQGVLILLLVIVLPTAVFGVVPWAMGTYDSSHHHTIECSVTKVYAESTSTRSGRGVGASGRQIVFATSDCGGHILLTNGVYWDNVKELAASLKPGRYEFTVGDSEWKLAPIYKVFRVSPSAQKYSYLGL